MSNELIDIIDKASSNKINYELIRSTALFFLKENKKKHDINFIVPVRGRKEFLKPLFECFNEAKNNIYKNITFTIVEQSTEAECLKFCNENKINYIYIHSKENEVFNKCLCYNVGVLYSCDAKYLVLHDLDILFNKNFFVNIYKILTETKCKALQTYTKKRVLFCNKKITEQILKKEVNINKLTEEDENISSATPGSTGGSIFVERNLFFNVGGYDPEYFYGYSYEDMFFWEKLSTLTEIKFADNPEIELFHLHHKSQEFSDAKFAEDRAMVEKFRNLDKEEKEQFLMFKKDILINNYK
jgi:hypothetical protein